MNEDYADSKIINTFFTGDLSFKSEFEECEQIYIPINDLHEHWFLAIVDLDMESVFVCDTNSDEGLQPYRRHILDKVVREIICINLYISLYIIDYLSCR